MPVDDGELLLAGDSVWSLAVCFLRRFGIAIDDDILLDGSVEPQKNVDKECKELVVPKVEYKK